MGSHTDTLYEWSYTQYTYSYTYTVWSYTRYTYCYTEANIMEHTVLYLTLLLAVFTNSLPFIFPNYVHTSNPVLEFLLRCGYMTDHIKNGVDSEFYQEVDVRAAVKKCRQSWGWRKLE